VEDGPEVLESHAGRQLPCGLRRALTALVVLAAAVAGTSYAVTHRPQPAPRCGISGHASWCRQPSQQMTDPGLARVVSSYCRALAGTRLTPQPMRLLSLAEGPTRAIDSGRPGTEDALLGNPRSFARVTLWSGGRYDGRVTVRCPGGTRVVPVLDLTRDQLISTVSALGDVTHRSIDFAGLGAASARRTSPDLGASLGTFSCDTAGVDLRALRPGQRFACQVEIFRLMGKGIYPLSYEVTRSNPYARFVAPTGRGTGAGRTAVTDQTRPSRGTSRAVTRMGRR